MNHQKPKDLNSISIYLGKTRGGKKRANDKFIKRASRQTVVSRAGGRANEGVPFNEYRVSAVQCENRPGTWMHDVEALNT